MTGLTFEDVCPLLLNERNGYSLHVMVATYLQLITTNLPLTVSCTATVTTFTLTSFLSLTFLFLLQESNFVYQCDIGGRRLPATRNNASSLTCNVVADQVLYATEV